MPPGSVPQPDSGEPGPASGPAVQPRPPSQPGPPPQPPPEVPAPRPRPASQPSSRPPPAFRPSSASRPPPAFRPVPAPRPPPAFQPVPASPPRPASQPVPASRPLPTFEPAPAPGPPAPFQPAPASRPLPKFEPAPAPGPPAPFQLVSAARPWPAFQPVAGASAWPVGASPDRSLSAGARPSTFHCAAGSRQAPSRPQAVSVRSETGRHWAPWSARRHGSPAGPPSAGDRFSNQDRGSPGGADPGPSVHSGRSDDTSLHCGLPTVDGWSVARATPVTAALGTVAVHMRTGQ